MTALRNFRYFLILPFLMVLTACSYNFLPQSDFFDEEVMQSFEIALEHITNKDASAIIDMSILGFSELENVEEKMEALFSHTGQATGATFLKAEYRYVDESKTLPKIFYAAYEYKNEDKYDIVEIVLQKNEGKCCFLRHVKMTKNDFQSSTYHNFKSHKFDFKRLGFLGLMIGTLIFILVTLIRIIRDKNLKRKWLWVIFVIFGVYGLTFNWTTGEIGPNFISFSENGGVRFTIITFDLLAGGFTRSSLFHPWIFEWGFPLGAVVYTIKALKRDKSFSSS